MDRVSIYPGQIPLETDLLGTNKNTMIALAKLASAILGTTTQLHGLACTPNSPAALNVIVGPGQIYSLQNIDGTAYSSIPADTAHSILKQGILLDSVTLSCPAPATAGQSINYLVQVAYQDIDTNPVVLPYYNASNPSQAYSGPNNAGTTNNTLRQGACVVGVKAGIAATTGSQVTPSADAGYTGAYVVTVANGQTSITSGNIATASGAPFITETLTQKISQTQADARYAAIAGLSTQVFSVAPATLAAHALNQTAADALYKGLRFSGQKSLAAAGTLTPSDIGKLIICGGGSPYTVTLPAANSVTAGQSVSFLSQGVVITLARAGSDTINQAGTVGLLSLAIPAQCGLTLTSDGVGSWQVSSAIANINGAFGDGQDWAATTIASGTTYYNTSGRTQFLQFSVSFSSTGTIAFARNGASVFTLGNSTGTYPFMVPIGPGQNWSVTLTGGAAMSSPHIFG